MLRLPVSYLCVVCLPCFSFLLPFQVNHCELSGKSLCIFVASLLGEQQQLCTCEFSSVPPNHILIWSFFIFLFNRKDACSKNIEYGSRSLF